MWFSTQLNMVRSYWHKIKNKQERPWNSSTKSFTSVDGASMLFPLSRWGPHAVTQTNKQSVVLKVRMKPFVCPQRVGVIWGSDEDEQMTVWKRKTEVKQKEGRRWEPALQLSTHSHLIVRGHTHAHTHARTHTHAHANSQKVMHM